MSNILILGSGSRESVLVWKLKKSKNLTNIYVSPGNGGTNEHNVSLKFEDIPDFVNENNIDYVIPGSETYLVKGITDILEKNTHTCVVGPNFDSARLETSKSFAKSFMKENNIPTADYETFNDIDTAKRHIENEIPPFVIKANGLAGGKGVTIANTKKEAYRAIENINRKFGRESFPIVIEKFLKGIEVSMFALCDGKNYVLLPEAKDYKQLKEKNRGPNTGGMGAISPVPIVDDEFIKKVEEEILKPTLNNIHFKGFLFLGLMNIKGNPYVIEYNARLGDPEATVIIPRIQNDLLDILENFKEQKLSDIKLEFSSKCASSVILASDGYPDSYNSGFDITYDLTEIMPSLIFHAGTKMESQKLTTNGGRVLCVTTLNDTIKNVVNETYISVDKISYKGKIYRKDIGFEFIT